MIASSINTHCQLPKNLILEQIKGYQKGWRDKYIWVLNSIIFKRYTYGGTDEDFTHLNFKLLKKYIGTEYLKKVLNQLEKSKVIEIKKQYIPGEFSRSYRLGAKYRNKELVNIKLSSKKKEAQYFNKVLQYRSNDLKRLFETNPLLQSEFRKLTYFRINVDKAVRFVKCRFQVNSDSYKYYMASIRNYNEMYKASFINNLYICNFTFIYKGGRLYTPVTQLPRLLETFTYEEGKEVIPLRGIDMKASQIKFYDLKINGQPSDETKFLDWQKVIWSNKEDCYLKLMELSNYKGKTNGFTKEERNRFKREVFWKELYYNKYNPKRLTNLERVFMIHYPEYFGQLQNVKKDLGKEGNKKLARLIHKEEGKFFHTTVVSHLERNNKDLNYNIKHDCIKVTEDKVEQLKAEIDILATNLFGRNINLEIE